MMKVDYNYNAAGFMAKDAGEVAACTVDRLNCHLNNDRNKIEINPVSLCALGGGTDVKLY